MLELGLVPGGYGWVFPKGDHANFGIGGWEREGPGLRGHLRALCAAHGVPAGDLESVRGYRLPLRSPRSTLARGRAAVIGDAAGLVDPVSGDGMFEGFLSGKLAAEAVLDLLAGRAEGLDPYGERLTGQLGTHLWASWGVKAALDRFPRTTFAIARSRDRLAHRREARPRARSTTSAAPGASPVRRSRLSLPSPGRPATPAAPTGRPSMRACRATC